MKVCPECTRTWPSDQEFCLDDGVRLQAQQLVENAATVSSPDTRRIPSTNLAFPPPMSPLPAGAQVGEYLIDKQIGEGGMGVIFSATHPVIGKQVAIKVLNADLAASREIVMRFVQEAKSVNQIRHRNIVDIFSFGTLDDGRHYFVMELLEGEAMSARIKRGPVAPEEALSIWIQAASAIEAAHGKGIVHRDLKPDNIFLCPSAEGPFVKVLDFGIAKLLGDTPTGMTKTSTGVPIGTPLYMSPEQASGAANIDHRTDLYAFGIVMYETIAGRPPFGGNTFLEVLSAQLTAAPPPLAKAFAIDPDLDRLIEMLLHKDADGRPPDMGAVRQRLLQARERAAREPLWRPLRGTGPIPAASVAAAAPRAVEASGAAAPPRGLAWLAVGGVAFAAAGVALFFAGRKPLETPPPAAVVTPAPVPVVVTPPPATPRAGRVTITTNALGTRVYLACGAPDPQASPAAAGGMNLRVQVPADTDCTLRVEADGFQPVTLPIRLAAGEESALPVLLAAAAPAAPAKHASSHGNARPPVAPKADAQPEKKPEKKADGPFMNPF